MAGVHCPPVLWWLEALFCYPSSFFFFVQTFHDGGGDRHRATKAWQGKTIWIVLATKVSVTHSQELAAEFGT